MYNKLRLLQPEVIDYVRKTGRAPVTIELPPEMVEYINQLNRACIYVGQEKSLRKAAQRLQDDYPNLSIRTCQSRAADAIKYLYDFNDLSANQWRLFYADIMMERAKIADEKGDIAEARRCIEKAAEYTEAASKDRVDRDLTQYRPQLLSPDVTTERMGIEGASGLKQLKERALSIIDSRKDLSPEEKARLQKEIEAELG